MKVLLDECLDQQFRLDLAGHDVFTVGYLRWDGTKNGRLLARAAAADFGGLVTTDRGIEHQQNPARLPITVYLLVGADSNKRPDLLPFTADLLAALGSPPATPRVVHITR